MSQKKDLLSRLNAYYEELSRLNREIERELRASVPSSEKISELVSRKDFIIEQCIKIKDAIENIAEEPSGETPDYKKEQNQNIELAAKMMHEEELNQELMRQVISRIKEELSNVNESKKQVKSYQQTGQSKYGSINRKV